jgi:hypothetical protein
VHPQQLVARLVGDRRALQLLAPRIDQPQARPLSEPRAEIEGVGRSLAAEHVIGRLAERDLARAAPPLLVLEAVPIDADRVVELRDKAARVRHRKEGGALVRHQPLAADEELVVLRLAPEHRVVVEDEARLARAGLPLEEEGRGEPGQAAAHDHEVEDLRRIDDVARQRLELPVPDRVGRIHDVLRVAVREAVVADASVSRPVVARGQQGRAG